MCMHMPSLYCQAAWHAGQLHAVLFTSVFTCGLRLNLSNSGSLGLCAALDQCTI